MDSNGTQKPNKRFNGAAWSERQVRNRTRAALTERGSKAPTYSREYKIEYARQAALFRAERIEKKNRNKNSIPSPLR